MHQPTSETRSFGGAEICIEAFDLITGDRNEQYDHPYDDYRKVALIFYAMTGIEMTVDQAVMFPLAMKLARMRTAREKDQYHHDSVVDAIGYLGCLNMIHVRAHG
jgi:Domain of unknown function (DUF6378)